VRPLLDALADAIQAAGGAIPLPRYLEICLYTPGLGYYSGPLAKLGAAGDFVTAPEVSPLFGRCVARQCREVLDTLGGGVVLEVGAGTGALAADVLLALGELGCLPRRYLVLEVSADLRARQAETLARRAPGLRDRVEWIDRLPTGPITGVILANEVLDAIPFHRVRREAGGLVELWVTLSDAQLAWAARAPSDPRLPVTLAAIESETGEPLPQGYETEIAPAREAWIRTLAGSLGRGLLLLSDYGFARREYYHPQRTAGTLACHYRHRMHADPLALPGLQDVTAHVDFTAVARAGVEAGLTLAGFVSQADFLIATGMLDDLAAAGDDWQRLELTSAAKRLALPALMGEAFKVLGLTRGLDRPLRGFGLRDRRGRLER
jgi:SAM-dependent MidA family methyltransferase